MTRPSAAGAGESVQEGDSHDRCGRCDRPRSAERNFLIWAGFGKAGDPTSTMHYIASSGMPAASAAYVVAVIVELGGGLALLLGWEARAVGVALALFCLVTAAVFHSHFADRMMMIQLMKNLAMAGGLLQVAAYGPGAISFDAVLHGRSPYRVSGRTA